MDLLTNKIQTMHDKYLSKCNISIPDVHCLFDLNCYSAATGFGLLDCLRLLSTVTCVSALR